MCPTCSFVIWVTLASSMRLRRSWSKKWFSLCMSSPKTEQVMVKNMVTHTKVAERLKTKRILLLEVSKLSTRLPRYTKFFFGPQTWHSRFDGPPLRVVPGCQALSQTWQFWVQKVWIETSVLTPQLLVLHRLSLKNLPVDSRSAVFDVRRASAAFLTAQKFVAAIHNDVTHSTSTAGNTWDPPVFSRCYKAW